MSTDIVLPSAAMAPSRIGQATAVEQSRAVAEVQAAVLVARQFPRNEAVAIARMTEACKQPALANKAFFSFNRGGAVTGETIHLAKELARCWGNLHHGIAELSRDDQLGQSEMQAFAWDLETNERASTAFMVPHRRDTKTGSKPLTDMRDVYENNANNGARRLREMIFSVLPVWYIEQAKDICTATLKHGGGVPLPKRIADGIEAYRGIGIVVDQLERNLGRAMADWTDRDVAQLQVLFNSIDRGEITRDEAFPPARVTTDELPAAKAPVTQRRVVPRFHSGLDSDGHDEDVLDPNCPACQAQSRAMDQAAKAAS